MAMKTNHRMGAGQLVSGGLGLAMIGLGACAPSPPPPAATAPPPPPPALPVEAAAGAPVETGGTAQSAPPPAPVLTVEAVGLLAPESILHDAESDTYLVANVNGKPLDTDRNGFISKIRPDGTIVELKWIDGAKPGTSLDAPKGMALRGDTLYVADITWIRLFDRKTGAAKGKLAVPGASFLNDVTVDADGVVYVSDTGWKGFTNSGTDAIHRIDPKVVVPAPLLRDVSLANPNGLAAAADGVWVASSNGELAKVTKDGKRAAPCRLPKGGLDGVVLLDDGSLLVSSWEGRTVYHGKPGGDFRALLADVESPADIGFDRKRGRLLIPQMTAGKLVVYELSALTGAAPAGAAPATAAAPPAAAPATASTTAAAPAPAAVPPPAAAK